MNYIIHDWETGGFNSNEHAVTELAAIAVDSSTQKEIGRISEFVLPYGDYGYTEKALEITGIGEEQILSGVDISELVDMMIVLFEKARSGSRYDDKPILVAHNAQFDVNFTVQAFLFCKKDLSKYVQGNKDFYGNFYPKYIDTVDLCKLKWDRRMGEIKDYKLGTCCQKAEIDLLGAHRAINDTLALSKLFFSLMAFMRANSGGANSEKNTRENFKFEI